MLQVLFLFPIIFALPAITLEQSAEKPAAVDFRLSEEVQSFERCLEGGLEVRYRYEYHVCRTRGSWFDWCEDSRLAINRVAYDAISETYRVMSDVHRDGYGPVKHSVKTLRKATELARVVKNVSLSHIAFGDSDLLKEEGAYLSARVEVVCEGDFNKTLGRLSSVLTFGIIDSVEYSSGWVDVPVSELQ